MDKELLEAVGEAIEALQNVPQVGEVYDQKHSDTHMKALLRLMVARDAARKAGVSA